MAVFDNETQSFWVSPNPKDKSGVLYELTSENKKKVRCVSLQGNGQPVEI